MIETDREKRCIWCSLPKSRDNACVCDDPSYEMMEQCSRCETWREVDQLHIADGVSEDVVCTARCMMTDGGQSTSETYRAECPECGDDTTFSEGGKFGSLSCDSCGYTPRRKVRQDIRSIDTGTDGNGGDA